MEHALCTYCYTTIKREQFLNVCWLCSLGFFGILAVSVWIYHVGKVSFFVWLSWKHGCHRGTKISMLVWVDVPFRPCEKCIPTENRKYIFLLCLYVDNNSFWALLLLCYIFLLNPLDYFFPSGKPVSYSGILLTTVLTLLPTLTMKMSSDMHGSIKGKKQGIGYYFSPKLSVYEATACMCLWNLNQC